VRVEGPQPTDVGGVLHAYGLHHLAAGAARGLGAVGRTLVPVQLKKRQPGAVGGRGDVVEGRVDEDAGYLQPPVQGGADLLGVLDRAGAGAPRPEDQANRPGPELRAIVGVVEARYAARLDASHAQMVARPPPAALRRPSRGLGKRLRVV